MGMRFKSMSYIPPCLITPMETMKNSNLWHKNCIVTRIMLQIEVNRAFSLTVSSDICFVQFIHEIIWTLSNIETGEPDFKRSCEIDEDFLDRNYKSSPDGVFSMNLTNIERLDMDKVDKLRIEFAGSNVPFAQGAILTSLWLLRRLMFMQRIYCNF